MLGILLVHKRFGCTSHDVVNDIRRKFNTRRVGHAGTLDPQATGVLVVAVGPATRFLQYLPLEPKEYRGRIHFGVETTTYDAEGEVVATLPVPSDLKGAIDQALPKFRGLIEQLPPMYSAVKVDGKPLYKYARQGQELQREFRRVHIDTFEISGDGPERDFRVVCSGGTYIRSLAHDLGQALGCGAHLSGLQRVAVGRFHIDDAVAIEDIGPKDLIPLKEALPPMPLFQVTDGQLSYVREGRAIGMADPPDVPLVALLDDTGEVFSIARVHGNVLQPECVIPAEVMHGAV